MPNRDRRGPLGDGPRTGRGQGCRRGMGRGWRNWFRSSGQSFGWRQKSVVSQPEGTDNSFSKDELEKELIKLEQEVEFLRKKIATLEK